MANTVRANTSSADTGPIPAAGVALAALSFAGLAVPIRRGVDEPIIWAALGLTALALTVFLARRYGSLDHSISGPLAAVSSVSVLLLSGYAVNQGVTGSTPILESGISVPTVFGTFLTAGIATSLAVADYGRLSVEDVVNRVILFIGAVMVAFAGMILTIIFGGIILYASTTVGGLSEAQQTASTQVGMAAAVTVVTAGYLVFTGRSYTFLDIRPPTLRDIGWLIGGLVALFGALVAIETVMTAIGAESANHSTEQQAQQNPEALLVLVPAALFIIGPFEELLYRNIIQKMLYDYFSRAGAVIVASIIFAMAHTAAYWTAGPGAVLGSLAVVFGLSLILGGVYERTEKLLIPALVHGIYNAIIFVTLYSSYAGA